MHGWAMARQALRNVERSTPTYSRRSGERRGGEAPSADIPRLIRMVGSSNQQWREKAARTLARATWSDFGCDAGAWRAWHDAHRYETRFDWARQAVERAGLATRGSPRELIATCLLALAHERERARSAALFLLHALTGKRFTQLEKWESWWRAEGGAAPG